MLPLRVVVCAALFVLTASTNVKQCPGNSIPDLTENVQLLSCAKTPCKLKKGKDQQISVAFIPSNDENTVINHVTAEVFGVPLPFPGVDGFSICDKIYSEDGNKATCPVKAGNKYVYKDSFPVLDVYPSINTRIKWRLSNDKGADLSCFTVQAMIQ